MIHPLPQHAAARPWAERYQTPLVALACILAGLAVGVACVLVNPLYLLAAAPVLIAVAWALRDAKRGLWLMILVIALVPRIASPVSIGFKPTLLDGAMLLTLGAWLLWRNRQTPSTQSAITLPLLILIVFTITTFVLGIPNGALTTLVIRRFGELIISLLMVFVLVSLLRQDQVLPKAVRLLMLGGAGAAIIAIILYVIPGEITIRFLSALRPFGYPSGDNVLRFVRDDPSLLKRATGLWIDPNAFGGYLLMTGALVLPQLFTSKPVAGRLLSWLCMGLIGLALVLTVSRSAILGLGFAGLLIAATRYRRILPLAALVLLAALALPQTASLVNHFLDGFAGRDLATQMRFGEYKDAIRLIERYPFFGVGFLDTPDIDLYIGVSSMYLLIAEQIGLLGLSAYLLVFITLFGSAVRNWHAAWQNEQRGAIWLGAHTAVAGAMLSGTLDHYFFNIDFHNSVMLFWLVVAIALAARES